MSDIDRIERLRKMYWKYVDQGLTDAAKRTVARIHELGGTLARPEKVRKELDAMDDRGEL